MTDAILAEIARMEAEVKPQRDALYAEYQRLVKRTREADRDIAALNRAIKTLEGK